MDKRKSVAEEGGMLLKARSEAALILLEQCWRIVRFRSDVDIQYRQEHEKFWDERVEFIRKAFGSDAVDFALGVLKKERVLN